MVQKSVFGQHKDKDVKIGPKQQSFPGSTLCTSDTRIQYAPNNNCSIRNQLLSPIWDPQASKQHCEWPIEDSALVGFRFCELFQLSCNPLFCWTAVYCSWSGF